MEEIKLKNSESPKVKGTHIITLCSIKTDRAKHLEKLLESVRVRRRVATKKGYATDQYLKDLWLEYNYYLEELHKKFKTQQFALENVTCTVGRSVLAQRLSGTTTYSGTVNYGALGTDNTSAAVGDTTLGTETYRKALSSGTYSNNIAYLENFYTAAEVNGTFEEYGFFIDGTGTTDSGQLFNRFTQSVTKSNTESLNVQSVITLNDA